MDDRPAGDSSGRMQDRETGLSRALQRAWWAILWERVWPGLAAIATIVGLFLAASWVGLWLFVPPLGRAVGLGFFGILLLISALPLFRLSLPLRADGLRRLDRTSALPHRPATAVSDRMATRTADEVATALWRAHLERTLKIARDLKAGLPAPRLALRDPAAIRALTALLLVATFFGASGERWKRVGAAFDWTGVVRAANFRVDAWVTPPPYTGRAPIIMPGIRPGEQPQNASSFLVPVNSVLVVRATGVPNFKIATSGGLTDAGQQSAPTGSQTAPAGSDERRFTIEERGTVTLSGIGRDFVWAFNAIPDRPPTISLAKEPDTQQRGSLQLSYQLEDDYGVSEAQATFAPKIASKTVTRPLFEGPNFPLVLPQARTRNGVGQTTKDLTEHPFAGLDVTMTLIARDEAGNEGRAQPHNLRLPERLFTKPMAKALIEQRRNLALDANARPLVLTVLDALTIAPEKFMPEKGLYLNLRSLHQHLTRAKSDEHLREVVARMWTMALAIEDGNLSDVEAALRAAQEALRQALERGAGDEELKRLMDELRATLDKFMQALAEQLKNNPQQLSRPLDRNARVLTPQDLKNMLDRLEKMARSGAKDAAKQMLQDLQAMLDNLQMARPGDQDGDMDDDMSALDELSDMIQKQQQLRDKTFKQGQDQQRNQRQRGQRGQNQPGQDQEGQDQDGNELGDLQKNQQALREQLKKLLDELRKRGQLGQQGQPGQPGQQGQQRGQGQQPGDALGQAEGDMGDAGQALGQGNSGDAVDSQGRALDNMRRGAQGLAQQMQQGQGQGPGERMGRMGPPGRAQQETDPLGRPLRGREYGDDTSVKVPGEIDVQRARRILEELRRRFADPLRPQLELDYIERLLRGF